METGGRENETGRGMPVSLMQCGLSGVIIIFSTFEDNDYRLSV